MEQIHDRVAGLDVHRDSVTACFRRLGPKGGVVREKDRFTTTTVGLSVLADWLGERQVELVAMEATGVYWKPVYYALEQRFVLWLCNARNVKKVPGRKTDLSDAEWLADVATQRSVKAPAAEDDVRNDLSLSDGFFGLPRQKGGGTRRVAMLDDLWEHGSRIVRTRIGEQGKRRTAVHCGQGPEGPVAGAPAAHIGAPAVPSMLARWREPMSSAASATPPTTVVVSGHMVDTADRAASRFPPDQMPRVTAEIRGALERWNVGPGTTLICGGARGPDLIAAEEALGLHAEVTLCLALPAEEFERRSVVSGDGDWGERFRAVLARADVQQLADPPSGDEVFASTNEWMIDLARSRAGGPPHAVVVWNGRESGDGPGGTADFLRRLGYTAPHDNLVVIDPTRRAYESKQPADGPKKLLALDGGGIRGVLSLEILRAIEDGLRAELGQNDLRLSEYFDYIGGTSTGAIIAAGLACGMSVETLVGYYEALGKKSFSRSLVPLRALYQAKPLAEELNKIFGADRTLGDPDLKTLLLLVMHNTETDSAWPLSNCTQAKYNRADRCLPEKRDRNLELPLAGLLRASTAAPVYFPAQTLAVGSQEFVFQDGGITPFNNPALLLFLTATLPEYGLEWPLGEDKLLVVSVGTGAAPAVHEGLARRQIGYLFNAKNLTSVFMNGSAVGQDVLCRSLGCCRFGEPIDREFGARLDVTGISGSNLFTYLRYNADLSSKALEKQGITGERKQKRLRKLDAIKAMPQLRQLGRSVGATVDVPRHFMGFL